MTAATFVYALLFYAAVLVLAGGLAHRIYVYARVPAPLKIPTTPAPTTSSGVALRLLREVLLFESLFKSNLWTWACGWPRSRSNARSSRKPRTGSHASTTRRR